MALLVHGTTLQRARRIAATGPIPTLLNRAAVFGPRRSSTYLKSGPFLLGTPEEYARQKAAGFPGEGGPAIIEIDVPDQIIALAIDEYFPLSQGVVQFDEEKGLEQLRAAWASLSRKVYTV